MARSETLEEFTKKLPSFPVVIQKRILKDWQTYTDEVFAQSQNEVPIASGALLRSGSVLNAKITSNGIESAIVYNLPYARKIHDGEDSKGRTINLKPAGYVYPDGTTKAREGEYLFLEEPARTQLDDVTKAISKSISKAWALL